MYIVSKPLTLKVTDGYFSPATTLSFGKNKQLKCKGTIYPQSPSMFFIEAACWARIVLD